MYKKGLYTIHCTPTAQGGIFFACEKTWLPQRQGPASEANPKMEWCLYRVKNWVRLGLACPKRPPPPFLFFRQKVSKSTYLAAGMSLEPEIPIGRLLKLEILSWFAVLGGRDLGGSGRSFAPPISEDLYFIARRLLSRNIYFEDIRVGGRP